MNLNKNELKRIAKMLGLSWSNETEQKIVSLASNSPQEEKPQEPVESSTVSFDSGPRIEEMEPRLIRDEKIGFCIFIDENETKFKVVKLKFNPLYDGEVCGTYDNENRAIFERGKLEAANRADEFRKKLKQSKEKKWLKKKQKKKKNQRNLSKLE